MQTTRLSSKGQVVLPKSTRQAMDWSPGAMLSVEHGDGYVILRKRPEIRPTTIDEVAGCLKYDGPPVTLEDMDRAIEEELRERWARKSR